MKEFIFVANDISTTPANITCYQPFSATLVLSDAAVTSGIATTADIISFTMTAGTAIPDSCPITLNDLLPYYFSNPQVTLSADRKTVTAFSAVDTPSGWQRDHWVLFQGNPPNPTMEVGEHDVYLYPEHIYINSDILPAPPDHYCARFSGGWRPAGETSKIDFDYSPVFVTIDPLSLGLSPAVYIKLHLPDPPPFEAVQTHLRNSIERMSNKEKIQARARIKSLRVFTEALEKEFEPQKKREKGETGKRIVTRAAD